MYLNLIFFSGKRVFYIKRKRNVIWDVGRSENPWGRVVTWSGGQKSGRLVVRAGLKSVGA